MNKKDQYKRLISLSSAFVLVITTTLLFAIAWYVGYSDEIMFPFYRRGNWVVIAIYTIMMALFFKAYGGFKIGYLKKADMFYSHMISIFCVNVVAYFQISLIGRHFMNITPMLLLTVSDLIFLASWNYITDKIYFAIYPPRRLVILYGSKQASSVVLKMSSRVDKYMICESLKIDENCDDTQVKEHIMQYDGVIFCDIPAKERNKLLKFCFEIDKRAYIVPNISDIIIRGADDIRLFDTPILLSRNNGLSIEKKLFKRIFDIIFSFLMLVILSPIMIVTTIAVKICDGGPVLYKQKRLTINGKEFDVYKFRSMIVDAEKEGTPLLAKDCDNRITPVGRVIRKFRIDEFPQLINILKGEMSLVGPRPERPELTKEYEKDMPEFSFRLKVKAGLTGYAQVTGTYDTSPYDKLRMDLMYIQNYSIRFDIQIILMTLKTMFFPNKLNEQTQNIIDKINRNEE